MAPLPLLQEQERKQEHVQVSWQLRGRALESARSQLMLLQMLLQPALQLLPLAVAHPPPAWP